MDLGGVVPGQSILGKGPQVRLTIWKLIPLKMGAPVYSMENCHVSQGYAYPSVR